VWRHIMRRRSATNPVKPQWQLVGQDFPQKLLDKLARGHAALGRPRRALVPHRIQDPHIPTHGFALRVGWQCRDLHRCLHWWMVEAIDEDLDEEAEVLYLTFEPIEALHCSSVEPIHCTGV